MKVLLPARQKGSFLSALAAAVLGGLFSAPASAIHGSDAVTVSNCGVQATKPTGLTIACGDGNDYLKSLAWTVWSDAVARGSGVEEVNDCDPYCAAGKFHSYPVTVTLDRVQSNRFTRLRIHYSKARPPHTPQDVSRTLQSLGGPPRGSAPHQNPLGRTQKLSFQVSPGANTCNSL